MKSILRGAGRVSRQQRNLRVWGQPAQQPTPEEMNSMRESLDEEYNWLPEALWVDGRRATMQELYAADPNGKERDMDELMSQRGHPLRQGIKAAFEQRVALKGRQMEEESEKLVRHHIPDGLSPEQELIYLRLKEENHTEDYNNRIKTAVTSEEILEERYENSKERLSLADIRRFNREGEMTPDDLADLSSKAMLMTAKLLAFFYIMYGIYYFSSSAAWLEFSGKK